MTTQTQQSEPREQGRGQPKPATPLKTWAFDSVGPRKYALQVAKASNGNPCIKVVEGVPQSDGTYRKFNVTIWSEDFDAFLSAVDQMRDYIRENDIRTPAGHRYDPNGPPRSGRRR